MASFDWSMWPILLSGIRLGCFNNVKLNHEGKKNIWYPWFELERIPQLAHTKVLVRLHESNKLANPHLKGSLSSLDPSNNLGLYGLTYLSLSTNISTCETVWESLWKYLMICHELFSTYFHKLFRIAYENSLTKNSLTLFFLVIKIAYTEALI